MGKSKQDAAALTLGGAVRRRSVARGAAGLAVLGLVAGLGPTMRGWPDSTPPEATRVTSPATAIPIAVLGDSNSQSYQDPVGFPIAAGERGGAFRSITLQWTEVLSRLRGSELDLGPWMQLGRSVSLVSDPEGAGLAGTRVPSKQDFLHNFANSGAGCGNLMRGRFRQAPQLVALMNQAPERWQRGVVVIRIGQNDWASAIDRQANDAMDPRLTAPMAYCQREIVATIALIRASYQSTRILLVGVLNEADDPAHLDRYQSAVATRNLNLAIARFNDMLRAITQGDPMLAFFDDAAWFRAHWGGRTIEGKPAFQTVQVGTTLRVTYSAGNNPSNALLSDHHAGLVWNALWAQSLVQWLVEAFGLPVTPISDDEVEQFIASLIVGPTNTKSR